VARRLEPPDYSLVTLRDGTVVIHQCSSLYDGPRFSLHDSRAQAVQSREELLA
jgi:3',5'-cyclic-AMP phosphodiesterase